MESLPNRLCEVNSPHASAVSQIRWTIGPANVMVLSVKRMDWMFGGPLIVSASEDQ